MHYVGEVTDETEIIVGVPIYDYESDCDVDDEQWHEDINNAVYAVWATESVGFKYRSEHKLKKIDINFKKEVSPDTPEIQIDVAIDGLVSRHKIKSGDTENAVVICQWEKI